MNIFFFHLVKKVHLTTFFRQNNYYDHVYTVLVTLQSHKLFIKLAVIRNISKWVFTTDLNWRYQTSFSAHCNLGSIWGYLDPSDHTPRNKLKHNAPMIFMHSIWLFACIYLTFRLNSRFRWHTHLMNHGYFDHVRNMDNPNWSPCLEESGTDSWISSLNLSF